MAHPTQNQTTSADFPLDVVLFSRLMSAFEPFEDQPVLAVAVSGGADSMALVLLADQWCRSRGGRVIAVTVDHGLRAEAIEEARWVGQQLAQHRIEHHILRWQGEKPGAAVQETARQARYHLLDDFIGAHSILHLLVAHHRDDQNETIAMRRHRNSGPVGAAGMSAVRSLKNGRLLRPLLPVPKARLIAYLRGCDQRWIEDPSNRNPAFERVRVRQQLSDARTTTDVHLANAAENRIADPDGMAETLGHRRQIIERAIGALLARGCHLDELGVAHLAWDCWQGTYASDGYWQPDIVPEDLPEDIDAREIVCYALGHVLRVVGGEAHAPARDSVWQVLDKLAGSIVGRVSLGGCVLHRRDKTVLVYREFGRMDHVVKFLGPDLTARRNVHWDQRFEARLKPLRNLPDGLDSAALIVLPLGCCDQNHKRGLRDYIRKNLYFAAGLPSRAFDVLPVMFYRDTALSVATLEICSLSDVLSAAGRPDAAFDCAQAARIVWRFVPVAPLWGNGFKIVVNP